MALQPKSTTVSVSVIVAAISVLGGMLGILKSCNDELEAKMIAKQQVGALRQDILAERVECNERIEKIHEECNLRCEK